MKVFEFTNGTKGKLLGEVNRACALGGWLVRKGEKVFKVTLTRSSEGWGWHSGATVPVYVNDKRTGEEALTPEQFGVEAICFCTGQDRRTKVWDWSVVGTAAWNKAACQSGILTAEFSRTITKQELAENIAFMVLHLRPEFQEAELLARCPDDLDPQLVRDLMADPAAVKRIMDR